MWALDGEEVTVVALALRRMPGARPRLTPMKKAVLLLIALVLPLLGSGVDAASSDDPRAARDEARRRRLEATAQLDALKAGEQELLAAAEALGDDVLAQAARVDAARQAVAVAEAEAQEAANSLAETKAEIAAIEQAVVDRAVQEYMSPHDDTLASVAESVDLAESARKHVLLDTVVAIDDDVLDALGAAREDYELSRERAEAAREKASARRSETEARLAVLERAQSEQRRLQAAITTRQREVLAEIDAQSASESALTRLIREREAAARASNGGSTGGTRAGGCIWPTRGTVTSEYGRRSGRQHQGIDIAAGTGTAIWAAQSGTVIFAGQQSGYGNMTIVDHGDFSTAYAHQSRIGVSEGQRVAQGDPIGAVGNTGRSTGPHLHFETRYGGSARNPRGCLP